jgi:hypothetical protein
MQMTNKTVELKDLAGLREFNGVDFLDEKTTCDWGDGESAQVCLFELDGVVYKAKEDPSDGYRSSCEEIEIVSTKIKNKFKAQKVYCVHMKRSDYRSSDLLAIHDVVTNKVVLTVGTDDNDDYYPSFVANFQPENMAINSGVTNETTN